MSGYIMNFCVYTMAMIGIIVVALLVYKKSCSMNVNEKTSLKIDDKIALNARKSLYVVNAGGERFLIAGDIDNTSLIARLGGENVREVPQVIAASNPIDITEEVVEPIERKSFISRETQNVHLPEFKPEVSDAQKSLDDVFSNIDAMKFDKYLDVKNIRKKPVMKELAKKLAQI